MTNILRIINYNNDNTSSSGEAQLHPRRARPRNEYIHYDNSKHTHTITHSNSITTAVTHTRTTKR